MLHNRYLPLALLFALGLALWGSYPIPAGEAVSPERIDKLIEQMGSGTFAEREKATKQLDALGVPALDALRKAAKSDDAEVKRRAEELVKKIEKQAESAKVLAAKRIHLVYKDTPVSEAVADFQKKSGYNLYLHDPQGKLKDRRITLDTGETTFWHALDLFCAKAELAEATMQDIMMPARPVGVPGGVPAPVGKPGGLLPKKLAPGAPPATPPAPPPAGPALAAETPPPARPALPVLPAPAAPPVALPGGAVMLPAVGGMGAMPGMPGTTGQILLKDGKSKKLPTDDSSAVRVRALPKSDMFGPVPAGEVLLALEITPEPKLQWQSLQSVRINKALDDQDQSLTQITPQVPAGPPGVGVGFGGAGGLPPGVGRPMIARPIAMWGGTHQQAAVHLKRGEKAAKTLKELKGIISAQVLTEAQPMLTADNLAKAAGKTFKGTEGGSLKIIEVKTDEQKQTTIRFEFEQPPNSMPAIQAMPAMPPGAPVLRPGVKLPPPPPPVGGPAPAPRPGAKVPPPAPAPAPAAQAPAVQAQAVQAQAVQFQVRIQGGGINAPVWMGPIMGLSVQDEKSNALPVQMGQQQFRVQALPGGNVVTATYTLICRPGKDQGEPAKLVYLGRKRMAIEIPFALKDVPLP